MQHFGACLTFLALNQFNRGPPIENLNKDNFQLDSPSEQTNVSMKFVIHVGWLLIRTTITNLYDSYQQVLRLPTLNRYMHRFNRSLIPIHFKASY